MNTTVYIINKSLMKLAAGQWIIPWSDASEINQSKPKPLSNLANLRIYGCKAYLRRYRLLRAERLQECAGLGASRKFAGSEICYYWRKAS